MWTESVSQTAQMPNWIICQYRGVPKSCTGWFIFINYFRYRTKSGASNQGNSNLPICLAPDSASVVPSPNPPANDRFYASSHGVTSLDCFDPESNEFQITVAAADENDQWGGGSLALMRRTSEDYSW